MKRAASGIAGMLAIAAATAAMPAFGQFLDERTAVAKNTQPTSAVGAARASAPGITRWKVRAGDRTVVDMLRRWGSESGWRVVIKNPPQILISGDDEFEKADFLQAADYVISQARMQGYRLKAIAYDNRVLVLDSE